MTLEASGKIDGSTVYFELKGTADEIDTGIMQIMGRYPTPGYGTWFNWPPGACRMMSGPNLGEPNPYLAPTELGDGRWIARGHRSTSCD